MENKKFIIILDYSTGEVFTSKYDSSTFKTYEEFYEHLNETNGLNLSDSTCSCMIVVDELNIKML